MHEQYRIDCTCKAFLQASQDHGTWRNLFYKLSESYLHPIPLFKPIEKFAAAELEAFVLRWIRTSLGWASDRVTPSYRLLEIHPSWDWQILEGGRWLIAAESDGSVLAHDLDHPDAEVQPIIQPKEEDDKKEISELAICMDRSTSSLTFNVAVIHDIGNIDGTGEPCHMSVWRVTLQEELIPTWKSERLSHLILPYTGPTIDIALGDMDFARIVEGEDRKRHIEIYDWRHADEATHLKSVMRTGISALHLRHLPMRRLLVAGTGGIAVYDIELEQLPFEDTPIPEEVKQPIYMVAIHGGPIPCNSLSPVYLHNDNTIHMTFVEVADYPTEYPNVDFSLGLHRVFTRQEGEGGQVFGETIEFGNSDVKKRWDLIPVESLDMNSYPMMDQKDRIKHPARGGQNLSLRYARLEKSLREKLGLREQIEEFALPNVPGSVVTVPQTRKAPGEMFRGFLIPEKPSPPEPDECCMSGCAVCVHDLYEESLEAYKESISALRTSLTKLDIPEDEWPQNIRSVQGQATPKPNAVALNAFEELERSLKAKKSQAASGDAIDDI
ncbi:hypothetical protein ONZ45_g5408 [Pleurotus djamor]|nr:hypothetical protein ONZ45_g5408 [Pleurotus djamor]